MPAPDCSSVWVARAMLILPGLPLVLHVDIDLADMHGLYVHGGETHG